MVPSSCSAFVPSSGTGPSMLVPGSANARPASTGAGLLEDLLSFCELATASSDACRQSQSCSPSVTAPPIGEPAASASSAPLWRSTRPSSATPAPPPSCLRDPAPGPPSAALSARAPASALWPNADLSPIAVECRAQGPGSRNPRAKRISAESGTGTGTGGASEASAGPVRSGSLPLGVGPEASAGPPAGPPGGVAMGIFFPELYLADEPCIQYNGAFISRSRFEALGGSLTAKWYLSIRVTATGEKLGAYLTRQGLPIFAGRRPRNPRQRKRKSETQAGPAQPAAKAKPAASKPAPSPFAAAAATAAAAIVAGTGPAGPDARPADGPQGGPERASCAAFDGPITDTAADADLSEESDGEPDWLALAWRQHSNELDGLKSVGSGEAAAAAAAWAAAACTAAADADMQPSMAAAPAPAPSAAAAVQRPCTGGGSAGPGAAVPQSCAVEPPSAFSLQMVSSGCSSGGEVTGGPRLLSADSSSGFVGGRVSLPGRNSGSPTQPALLAGPLGSSEQGLLLSSGSLQTAQTPPWQPSRPLPASLSLSRQLSGHPSQQMEEPALRRPSISASVPFGVEGGAPRGLSGGAAALTRQPSRGDACTHGPGFSSSPAAAAGILPPGGAQPYRRPPPPRLSQQGSFSDSVGCGVGWPTSPASPGAMGVGSAAGGLFGGGILMADLRARAAAAQAERTTDAPGSGPLLPAEAAMAPRRHSTGDRGTLAAPAAPFPASHAPALASPVEHMPPPPEPAAAAPLAPAAAAVTTGGVHPPPHGGARHHSGGGSATVSTGACGGPGSPWGRAPCAVAAPLSQGPPPEPCAAYRGHPGACSQPPPQPAAQDSPALPAPGPFAPPHATAAQWAHRPAPCPAPYHVTQPGCEAQHEPSSGVVVVHHHHYHVVVVPPHHSNHPNHLNRPNHLHSAVLPSVAAAQRFSGSGGWDPAAMAPPSALPGGPYDRSSTTYDYVMYE